MAELQAAKRYAVAALSLARESGSVAQWRLDLDDIAQVLTESQLAPLLADGRRPVEERLGMVERALDIQPLSLNLARLLVTRGRSLNARAVAEAFNRLADAEEGIVHAQLTTAVDLRAEQVRAIEQRLGQALGKTVVAQAITDPSIVGGIVVRVGDQLVDGSVKTRLKRLRRELEGAR